MKIYFSDLVDVFYLVLNSEMIQSNYKKIKAYIAVIYNELDENLLSEPLIKQEG
jgi:hypothetical protein